MNRLGRKSLKKLDRPDTVSRRESLISPVRPLSCWETLGRSSGRMGRGKFAGSAPHKMVRARATAAAAVA